MSKKRLGRTEYQERVSRLAKLEHRLRTDEEKRVRRSRARAE